MQFLCIFRPGLSIFKNGRKSFLYAVNTERNSTVKNGEIVTNPEILKSRHRLKLKHRELVNYEVKGSNRSGKIMKWIQVQSPCLVSNLFVVETFLKSRIQVFNKEKVKLFPTNRLNNSSYWHVDWIGTRLVQIRFLQYFSRQAEYISLTKTCITTWTDTFSIF